MLLLCLLAGLWVLPAQANEFTVEAASTRLVGSVYHLDASIDYQFTDTVLDALGNGVPLTLRVDIEVKRQRRYWMDATVANLEQRYQLHYHALSGQYLVRNVNSGAVDAYPTLGTALVALGTISDFPLLDAKLLEPDSHYLVEMQARLDIESLPSPLRPLAYVTPAWRLESDWYSWSLKR